MMIRRIMRVVAALDRLSREVTSATTNPTAVPYEHGYAVKFVVPTKGEFLWSLDAWGDDTWKHSMDFIRNDKPKILSKEDISSEMQKAKDYILRWKPGWDEFIR